MIVDVVVVVVGVGTLVVVGVAIDVVAVGVGILVVNVVEATVVKDGELGVLGVGVGDEEGTVVVGGGATTWLAVGLLDMKLFVDCCCELLFVSCFSFRSWMILFDFTAIRGMHFRKEKDIAGYV